MSGFIIDNNKKNEGQTNTINGKFDNIAESNWNSNFFFVTNLEFYSFFKLHFYIFFVEN